MRIIINTEHDRYFVLCMYVYVQHIIHVYQFLIEYQTICFGYKLCLDKFIEYADEQQPETAASVLVGISGPYTNLKKQRDEGKQ